MISSDSNKILLNFLFLFNILVIPFYLTGPFLPDLCVSLSGLFFLVYVIKNKEFNYFNNFYTKIFLIFYVYILFRSLFSQNIHLSLESSLFYFRFLFFTLSTYLCLLKIESFKKYFFITLFATFLFLLFDGFFQLFNGTNIFGIEREVPNRISGVFGEELVMGSFLSRTLPMIIAFILFFKIKDSFKSFTILFILGISFVLIFVTGERAALFNFIFFIFLFLLIIQGFRYLKLFILFLGPLVVLLTIYLNPIFYERMIKKSFEQMGIFSETKYLISKYHQPLYEASYKMFLDNKIFGHGPKLFRQLCSEEQYIAEYSCNTHPHNTYLQLLAETGIVGFLFVSFVFFLLIYIFFKKLINNIRKKNLTNNINIENEKFTLISLIIINLWPLVPTGSFFNNWLSILYFLPIGFLLYNMKLLHHE